MNNTKIFATTLLLTLLLCAPSFAQRQTSQQRQQAQIEAQKKEQRRIDEEAIRNMTDTGADLAFVVAVKANIREQPSRTSSILGEVTRGEALALVEREPTGTWYHVIQVDSAVEGWIDQSVIITKLTADRYNAPRFEEERTEEYKNPTVKITNQERSTDLNLKMNGTLFVIKANTTRSITLNPGHYEYYGWSPGVRATIGKGDLEKGYVYTWSFFIKRR